MLTERMSTDLNIRQPQSSISFVGYWSGFMEMCLHSFPLSLALSLWCDRISSAAVFSGSVHRLVLVYAWWSAMQSRDTTV